jgi:hypothetical protein
MAMRWPRMTIRRWMTTVAVLALGIDGVAIALRAPNQFRRSRYMSRLHAESGQGGRRAAETDVR